MIIAASVTIPSGDTGVSLRTLLETAGYDFDPPFSPRLACIKISYDGSSDVYMVPVIGAYTTTVGTIPDSYGWSFANQGALFEMAYPQNVISLDEMIVGGPINEVLHVWGYSI